MKTNFSTDHLWATYAVYVIGFALIVSLPGTNVGCRWNSADCGETVYGHCLDNVHPHCYDPRTAYVRGGIDSSGAKSSTGDVRTSTSRAHGKDRAASNTSSQSDRVLEDTAGGVREALASWQEDDSLMLLDTTTGPERRSGETVQETTAAQTPATEPKSPTYTLQMLVERAMANQPAVRQAQSLVDAARGYYIQVGLAPNPAVGYSGQQLGSRGQAEQQGVFLEQDLILGGKLRVQREEAAWRVRRATSVLAAVEHRVTTDVRIAFYEVLVATERVNIAGQLQQIARQALTAVDSLYKAQEATAVDLLQAQIEADAARLVLDNAQAQRRAAWQRLAAVVGEPDLAEGRLEGDVHAAVPALDFDELAEWLLANHPQLAAQLAEVERARWAVERAYRAVIPDLNVQGIVQDDRSTGTSNGALQVSAPIPLWNRNQGGIRQAVAELSAAEQSVERTALALRKRLAEVFQDYQVARQQTVQYREHILPNAEKSLRLVNEGYRAGELSYLQLLTAQRTYFQTQLTYLESLRQVWLAYWQLEGLLLSGSLENEPQ